MMKCENDPDLFDPTNNATMRFIDMLFEFQQYYQPVHGLICVVICIFGLLTNLIHVIVLTRPQMRVTAVNSLMTAVAICDMGTMASYLLYIFNFVLMKSNDNCQNNFTYLWMAFLLVHIFLSICLHTTSLYLCVLMAFMRRMSLRSASPNNTWQKSLLAKRISAVVFVFVFVFSLPTLFIHEIVKYPTNWEPTAQCSHMYPSNYSESVYTISIMQYSLEDGCRFFKLNLWATGMFFKVIPCVLLVVLSSSLMRKLQQAERKRRQLLMTSGSEHSKRVLTDRTTAMLLAILIVFIVTEFPQGILAILNAIYTNDVHHYIYLALGDVLDLLSLVNSSVNFILYCLMSSRYRHTFCQVVFPSRLCSTTWVDAKPSNFFPTSEFPLRVQLRYGDSPSSYRRPEWRLDSTISNYCRLSLAGANYDKAICKRVQ